MVEKPNESKMRSMLNKIYISMYSAPFTRCLIKLISFIKIDQIIRSLVYCYEARHSSPNIETTFITAVTDILNDNLSKDIYNAVWYFRQTSNRKELLKYCPCQTQYFDHNVIHLSNTECFVDCGAFTGDTIVSFLNQTKQYKAIYAFEPIPENYKQITDLIKKRQLQNITVYPIATGKTQGMVRFTSKKNERAASAISNTGELEVKLDTLDNILADKKITFIKMDIEGAETDTILGAKKIIQEQKPTLAICIYHSDSDMTTIPLLIHELVPEYKLFVRHYSDTWIETVVYAVI